MAQGRPQSVGEALAQAKQERDEAKTPEERRKAGYFGANRRCANRYSVGQCWHHV